ncbi:MAG: MBL fold metallo-hydrolase [Pseudomonadota bacterium]
MAETPNFHMTRRTALGALAATAASPAFAKAPMLGPLRPRVNRVKLGAFEVTTILDGATPRDSLHPMFGANASAEEVAALAVENGLPGGMAEFTFVPTLVNTGTELILFDTGSGEAARPGMGHLREQLSAAGYAPEDVDIVVITHNHPDHIGGMMEGGTPAFPNARYVTGQIEYDFWSSEDRVGSPVERLYQMTKAMVTPVVDKMTFLQPGDAIASGIEAVDAFGHTPGMMAFHIESEGKRLLLIADAANHYVLSMQRPDWHFGFDADKDGAVAARRRLMGMIAADKIPFTGYHLPFPALGYLTEMGDGFEYHPVSYQMNL